MNNQRQIVTWAFDGNRELNDSKRFDVDVNGKRGYAVVVLSGKTEEDGVDLSSNIMSQIRPELISKKKAALISAKIKGSTLEEIGTNQNITVRNTSSVTLASPLLSGVGNEPAVVGAMSTLAIDAVSDKIEGAKGVFVVQVTKREAATELENYDNFRKQLATKLKGRSYQLYKVLQDAAEVQDNRKKFF